MSLRKNVPLSYDSVTLEDIPEKLDIICLHIWRVLYQEVNWMIELKNTRGQLSHTEE